MSDRNEFENCKKRVVALMQDVEQKLSTTITNTKIERHVSDLCQTVISAGGKRIRPRLTILCSNLLPVYKKEHDTVVTSLASCVELLHTATLIHDDIIDKASLRRGKPTINETDGNHVAVLAGDYLFTRCFMALHSILSLDIIEVCVNTIRILVSGELYQLQRQGDMNISFDEYKETIYSKTGALFELATSSICYYDKAYRPYLKSLKSYGRNLGIAFQVIDDVLDYSSNNETLGKSIGEDLDDGRITLPIIFTLKSLESNKDKLETFKKAVGEADLKTCMQYINEVKALERSKSYAIDCIKEAKDALNVFDNSPYKDMLYDIADHVIDRIK